MDWCAVHIIGQSNEIALDEVTFDMPVLYRGTAAETVTIRQGIQRWPEFKRLEEGEPVNVVIYTPDEAGNFVRRTIRNWYFKDAYRGPGNTCSVTFVDRRTELARHPCPWNFNIRTYNGYVFDTARDFQTPFTVGEILERIVQAPPLAGAMAREDVRDYGIDTELVAPDDIKLRGLQMDKAIARLEEVLGIDLYTHPGIGGYMFAARGHRDDIVNDSFWQSLAWTEEPGWQHADRAIVGISKVRCPYPKRYTIDVRNEGYEGPGATLALPRLTQDETGEIRTRLRQVYSLVGQWLTLEELLAAVGYPQGYITEDIIAQHYMSDNWEGTPLGRDNLPDSVNFKNWYLLKKAIKDSWHRYYALVFLDIKGNEQWGWWTNIELGEQNALGGVRAGQVFCDWVEFTEKPEKQTRNGVDIYTSAIEHDLGVTYPGRPERIPERFAGVFGDGYENLVASPFEVAWKDKTLGIVEIKQDRSRTRGSTAIIGQLRSSVPGVTAKKPNATRESAVYQKWLADQKMLPARTLRAAEFKEGYRIEMYITAVRAATNGDSDSLFHYEEFDTGKEGGVHELPVNTKLDARYGYGENLFTQVLLNEDQLQEDTEKRGVLYANEKLQRVWGDATTLDVHRVVDRDLDPEQEVCLLRVRKNVILATVRMGAQAGVRGRLITEQLREVNKTIEIAGRKID